jgi:hypothetical protein
LTGAGKVSDKWLTLNEKGAFNRKPAGRATYAGDFERDDYGVLPISEFQN